MFNIFKFFKKKFCKPNLRDLVFQELGEEGVYRYDEINSGRPIGGFFETVTFLDAIEKIKTKYNY